MLENNLGFADVEELHRVEVDFCLESSLDSLIGRAAHVRYICDGVFLKMLANLISRLF